MNWTASRCSLHPFNIVVWKQYIVLVERKLN